MYGQDFINELGYRKLDSDQKLRLCLDFQALAPIFPGRFY